MLQPSVAHREQLALQIATHHETPEMASAVVACGLSSSIAPAAQFDVYILTGQSNSLGTTGDSDTLPNPGVDPADANIVTGEFEKRFWPLVDELKAKLDSARDKAEDKSNNTE